MKVKGLEADSGRLRVLGKGENQQIVWLGKADVKLILAYLEAKPRGPSSGGLHLFKPER